VGTLISIRVLFFARLRELAQINYDDIEIPEGASLKITLAIIAIRYPRVEPWFGCCIFCINGTVVKNDFLFSGGEHLAILPPASGGSPIQILLTESPLISEPYLADVSCNDSGGIVVFHGRVRRQTDENITLSLTYEAYIEAAFSAIYEIAEKAKSIYGFDGISIGHRLGKVLPGETSIIVAVGSKHRTDAFNACSHIMDQIKENVPIWKKDEILNAGFIWHHPGSPEDR